ncbi:MAG: ankyrin repeat domain-containing protein, partial [Rikenellaceae bacterium]|nr:ankyrin repeat domain-containing protein [Rikenellaceae bacterium]
YTRYSLSPLSYAIERKSIRSIRYFINNGMIDVNSRDSYGEAPLSYAISGGDIEIVRLLIVSGASPLLVDGSGVPFVELAVRSSNLDIVRSIVESASLSFGLLKQLHDYAVDNSTPEVATYLADMCAESTGRHAYGRMARIDDMRSVIPSVAKVINIDAVSAATVVNDSGDVRRHFAMCELAMLPELLTEIKKGRVDIERRNEFGYTLLHVACDKGYERIVEQLIASGANVNVRDNTGGAFSMLWRRRGETPLHRAAAINSVSIVRMLIDAGAKVNCYDYYHTTPLHLAALHGNYQMVRLLVDAGAKVSVRDDDGNEPVLMAVRSGGVAIVGCLLDNGANVNTASNSGETPLHRATRLGEVETALFLLKRGADINVQDIGYKSPLHISVERGLERLAGEYVRLGADTEALDGGDQAPRHYASKEGDKRLCSLFRRLD